MRCRKCGECIQVRDVFELKRYFETQCPRCGRRGSYLTDNVRLEVLPEHRISSHDIHDPSLRRGISLDVALGRAERGVPREHLDVTKRSPDRGYLPSRVRYDCSPPAVA